MQSCYIGPTLICFYSAFDCYFCGFLQALQIAIINTNILSYLRIDRSRLSLLVSSQIELITVMINQCLPKLLSLASIFDLE